MTKLTGAALDRAVAHAMGLKSVHNCEKWSGAMDEDDDDIQDYKRPWVGLTDEEIHALPEYAEDGVIYRLIRAAEAALRSKNNG
jgi:hypothetical protein